ncbi:MAG: hypothetical protein K0R47_383 [Brevibacillus sp.]|nr:hypothetical protein [Brevibacillus sp.]
MIHGSVFVSSEDVMTAARYISWLSDQEKPVYRDIYIAFRLDPLM